MAYEDTPNKAAIRQNWNVPIIKKWHERIGPLTYLGLTGPEIRDLIDWREFLDNRKTGIESIGRTKETIEDAASKVARINTNLMLNDMLSGYQQLYGDAEDIIINAVDANSDPPQINDSQPAHLRHFGYDLINLDFDGGLGYKTTGNARRIEAIKRLFGRQQGHSFILYLTVNVRHKLGEEINQSLRNLQRRDYGAEWQSTIEWYINHSKQDYKLKALVPALVNKQAETNGFRCTCHPPIAYVGHERAHMIHFAFELENTGMDLPVYGFYDDQNIINLPLLRSENGRISVAQEQHPRFPFEQCKGMFNFLPEPTRENILATLPPQVKD